MTIRAYRVKPGLEEIARSAVAVWDQDALHAKVDPRWAEFGGAHIVGDPLDPDADYLVAATPGIDEAQHRGRLIVLEWLDVEEPAPPTPKRKKGAADQTGKTE